MIPWILSAIGWIVFAGCLIWGWYITIDPAPDERAEEVWWILIRASLIFAAAMTAAAILGRDV